MMMMMNNLHVLAAAAFILALAAPRAVHAGWQDYAGRDVYLAVRVDGETRYLNITSEYEHEMTNDVGLADTFTVIESGNGTLELQVPGTNKTLTYSSSYFRLNKLERATGADADWVIQAFIITDDKTSGGFTLAYEEYGVRNFFQLDHLGTGISVLFSKTFNSTHTEWESGLFYFVSADDAATTTETPTTIPATTTETPTTSPAPTEYMPTVVCRPSEVIVTVNKSRVANLNVANMFAGENSTLAECSGSEDGDDIIFSFGLTECNPEMNLTDTDYVKFTYMISTGQDDTVGAISRTNHGEIEVFCLYPRNAVVKTDYEANRTFATYVGGANGSFTFSMSLYSDANLTAAHETDAVIPVGTPVYADIRFENPSLEVNMFVQDCVATPEADNSTYSYELIKPGGCFGDDETFAVVTTESKEYTFEFEAFRFTGVDSEDVYLKCNLYVCQSSDSAASCQHPRDCNGEMLLTRDVNAEDTSAFPITFGPIKVQ